MFAQYSYFTVPIYDARHRKRLFNGNTIPRLQYLPVYTDDVSVGGVAMVLFTAHMYGSTSDERVSFNLKSVVILSDD